MSKPKEYSAVEQEILAAVGELLVSQLAGRDELARGVFEALAPQFMGRYSREFESSNGFCEDLVISL